MAQATNITTINGHQTRHTEITTHEEAVGSDAATTSMRDSSLYPEVLSQTDDQEENKNGLARNLDRVQDLHGEISTTVKERTSLADATDAANLDTFAGVAHTTRTRSRETDIAGCKRGAVGNEAR